jgi:hypothetical protein
MKTQILLLRYLALSSLLICHGCSSSEQKLATAPSTTETPEVKVQAIGPEDVLRQFLISMATGDQKTLVALTVPTADISVLLPAQPLPSAQQESVTGQLKTATITHLKAGDVFTLPDGRKVQMNDSMVNDSRQQLTMPGSPFPFILVRTDGSWRVDASPLISMRKTTMRK